MEDNKEFKIGDKVYFKMGFYKGEKGIILEIHNSSDTIYKFFIEKEDGKRVTMPKFTLEEI